MGMRGVVVGTAAGQVSFGDGASSVATGFGTALAGHGIIACVQTLYSHNPITIITTSNLEHVAATQNQGGFQVGRIDYSFAPGTVRTLSMAIESTVNGGGIGISIVADEL
jgi:hypothetical protein